MNQQETAYLLPNIGAKKCVLLLVALLIVIDVSVVLNIPAIRQVLSFIYLTFLPGWLILLILKLNHLDLKTKIVLSVGLSVSFIMLFGLLINSSLLALNYEKPLSTIPVLIAFNLATIILVILAYWRNRDRSFSFSDIKLNTEEKVLLVLPSLFPLISVVGTRIMNLTDNNLPLLVVLFLIVFYVVFIVFYRNRVTLKIYPLSIFAISISLVLIYSLRSNHVIGSDVHLTYYWFQMTQQNLHWATTGVHPLNSSLTISILPSIYQAFLNIAPEFVFKITYSLIVSFSPLVIFIISVRYVDHVFAFLASFFFMSQILFLHSPELVGAGIAVFFFALMVMTLFHDELSGFSERMLFIIFMVSIIMSHYGTSYIALFVFVLVWIGVQVLSQVFPRREEATGPPQVSNPNEQDTPALPLNNDIQPSGSAINRMARYSQIVLKKGITSRSVILFITLLFFWYSMMTGPSFTSGVNFIKETFVRWKEFFSIEARGDVVQAAFSTDLTNVRIPQEIEFIVSWLIIAVISVGILITTIRLKRMITLQGSKEDKVSFLSRKLDIEYFVMSVSGYVILVFSVVFPYISEGYEISRTYYQMSVVLASFFVVGGMVLSSYLKLPPHWLIVVITVVYFLCTTGVVSQMFSFPREITLNSTGPIYISNYTTDQESYAGKWIGEYRDEKVPLYNIGGARRLVSQAGIPEHIFRSLSPGTLLEAPQEYLDSYGYLYLGYSRQGLQDIPVGFFDLLDKENKIYSSGSENVYKLVP